MRDSHRQIPWWNHLLRSQLQYSTLHKPQTLKYPIIHELIACLLFSNNVLQLRLLVNCKQLGASDSVRWVFGGASRWGDLPFWISPNQFSKFRDTENSFENDIHKTAAPTVSCIFGQLGRVLVSRSTRTLAMSKYPVETEDLYQYRLRTDQGWSELSELWSFPGDTKL